MGMGEAAKYDASARMATTQRHLADRALQLLDLPAGPALLLDVGCGTGYSGRPLERAGHTWVGTDVSESMLRAARAAKPASQVLVADAGEGMANSSERAPHAYEVYAEHPSIND